LRPKTLRISAALRHGLFCDEHRRAGLRQRGAAGSERRDKKVVAQERQVHKLPAVQGQLCDSGIVDDFAQFRICGLKCRSRGIDRNFLVDVSDFQRQVNLRLPSDLQDDTLPESTLEVR
jgi:hypothetical protein